MPASQPRPPHRDGTRSHHRRRTPPTSPYLICLSTMAVACVLLVLLLLAVGPRWDSVVFGIPLGAFLLGGVGGLMTLGCSPSWPRRLGSRRGVRVVALTFYRLVAAGALGGIVYVLAAALVDRDGGEMYLVALGAGLLEKPLSDGLLKWAGLLARAEADVFV